MGSTPQFTMTAAVLGAPDPRRLAYFYRDLLGWPVGTDEDDWVTLRPGNGMGLSFQLEDEHVAPSWPSGPGDQQMQVHLDIEVDDLAASSARAVELGATVAEFQPQEDVVVHLDPAGHPFCLWTTPETGDAEHG